MTLLRKHLGKKAKNGPNIALIRALLSAVKSNINKRKKELVQCKDSNLNEFNCERSAFGSYCNFIDDYVSSRNHRNCALTQTQDATIAALNGESIELYQDDIIDIFTSRINSQDRNTGDKTFFPLGLIAKILPRGTVRDWARKEAAKVCIHLQSGSVIVSDITTLTIDTKTKEVFVSLIDGRTERVFEPFLGNSYSPMSLYQIKDTDLDHEPEIHTILQNMKGKLPGLDMLTDWIKKKQKLLGYKTINNKNYDKICNALYNDSEFQDAITNQVKTDLINDLNQVSTQHILQLTSSEWNRSAKKRAKKQINKPTI